MVPLRGGDEVRDSILAIDASMSRHLALAALLVLLALAACSQIDRHPSSPTSTMTMAALTAVVAKGAAVVVQCERTSAGLLISHLGIWRAANLLIRQHGADVGA
jgi:hypothetical protein